MVVVPAARSVPVAPRRGEIVWLESVAATDRARVGAKAAALAAVALACSVPPGFTVVGNVGERAVRRAYAGLAARTHEEAPAVAVRPSPVESAAARAVLGVRGADALLAALAEAGGDALPVFVQALVAADARAVVASGTVPGRGRRARRAGMLATALERTLGHPVEIEIAWSGDEPHVLRVSPTARPMRRAA